VKQTLLAKLQQARAAVVSTLDGRGGSDHDMFDAAGWSDHVARIQAVADRFRP
jgi:hypothetical protein